MRIIEIDWQMRATVSTCAEGRGEAKETLQREVLPLQQTVLPDLGQALFFRLLLDKAREPVVKALEQPMSQRGVGGIVELPQEAAEDTGRL